MKNDQAARGYREQAIAATGDTALVATERFEFEWTPERIAMLIAMVPLAISLPAPRIRLRQRS
jgi:hypothetical protein